MPNENPANPSPHTSCDIAIIGAGPIGIEMACALKKAGVLYRQIEAGRLASTIAWYAPGTQFFSSPERIAIAGYPFSTYPQPKATREEYLQYLRDVVHAEKLQIDLGRKVVVATCKNGQFTLQLAKSCYGVGGQDGISNVNDSIVEILTAKRIILAIGNMHIGNELHIPGEELAHVSHYFKEPHDYFGQKVVILGAKNSAAEAAARLVRTNIDVTVIMRGERFEPERIKPWLYPELLSFLKEGRLKVIGNAKLTKIEGGSVSVTTATGDAVLPADSVLLMTGYRQDPSLFEQLGISLAGQNRAPVFVAGTMETDIPGIFVIGTAAAGSEFGHVTSYIETSHLQIPKVLRGLGINAPVEINSRKLRDEETVET